MKKQEISVNLVPPGLFFSQELGGNKQGKNDLRWLVCSKTILKENKNYETQKNMVLATLDGKFINSLSEKKLLSENLVDIESIEEIIQIFRRAMSSKITPENIVMTATKKKAIMKILKETSLDGVFMKPSKSDNYVALLFDEKASVIEVKTNKKISV